MTTLPNLAQIRERDGHSFRPHRNAFSITIEESDRRRLLALLDRCRPYLQHNHPGGGHCATYFGKECDCGVEELRKELDE